MSARPIPRSFLVMAGFGVPPSGYERRGAGARSLSSLKPKLGLQSVVWTDGLTITAPTPTCPPVADLWDAITCRRLPRLGARAAASSTTTFGRPLSGSTSGPYQIVPERVPSAVRPLSAGWVGTLRRDRSRWAFCTRTSSPHPTSPTTRLLHAVISPTLDTSSSGGRPNFTHLPVNAPSARSRLSIRRRWP